MNEFLTGSDLSKAIKEVLDCEVVRCAVAFWGKGAEGLFGPAVRNAKIICNLSMGGTNPAQIDLLMKGRRFEIKQCDNLHAKVYIGEKVVITSANASVNGLGVEGTEAGTWIEAGVSLSEIGILVPWFDALWDRCREITPDDIKSAKDIWDRRRRASVVPAAHNLLEALRKSPSDYSNRRFYLVAYSKWVEGEEHEKYEKVRKERGGSEKLSGYVGWPDLPKDADLVDFYLGPKRGVQPTGYWHRPDELDVGDVQLCWKGTKHLPRLRVGDAKDWKGPLDKFRHSKYWKKDGGYVDLGVFAQEFLR